MSSSLRALQWALAFAAVRGVCNHGALLDNGVGRVKAKSLVSFSQVAHACYSMALRRVDFATVSCKVARRYFSFCVTQSTLFKTARGRAALVDAVLQIVKLSVSIFHALNSSPSERMLDDLERSFVSLERYAEIVDQVMPLLKGICACNGMMLQ